MLNKERHKGTFVRILKDIYTDNTLGPVLGFKGGTAAMLFYELSRFSVDLDFDLLEPEKEDEVFEKVGKIVARYGTVREQKKKHYTLFYEMSYSDADRNIKVEINRRDFGSRYEVMNYFGISMKVMIKEDMFANKLAALYERAERANRDIFDIWYFLQNNWPVNKALVEKRTALKFKESVVKCIEKLEKVPARSILSGMGELIDNKQKDWVKAKLKTETLFLLKVMLDRYLEVFTIISSGNLKYTKVPGHTFSGADKLISSYSDIKNATIQKIKKQNNKTLVVKIVSDTTGHEANCYIRSVNVEGVKELKVIADITVKFNGYTYDNFLNYQFKK